MTALDDPAIVNDDSAAVDAGRAAILAAQEACHPDGRRDRIDAAIDAAAALHRGQRRRSGDPYITHPLAVAELVADWGLDEASICAAVLHDVVEDTPATLEDVEKLFCDDESFATEVSTLVDGLTKLDGLKLSGVAGGGERAAAATFNKLLLAMVADVRVLVVKLADRLHNVRTLAALPTAKGARIARETMDVYAPLAARLGLAQVTSELEDRCFELLWPDRFEELSRLVHERVGAREQWLTEVLAAVSGVLADAGVTAEVTGRGKHLWSVYEKMVNKGRDLEQIYDLVGVRVLVEDTPSCYTALGAIHGSFQPIPGRLKDFVASPKYNLYQSLHTTVIGPAGAPVEIQIRTHAMHERAEWGVAAHWRYKDDRSSSGDPSPAWLTRLAALGSDNGAAAVDPGAASAFLEQLRSDLSADEIFCFTPDGDVVALPAGSTPVDFAYAVHTEVGHRCLGARVDGQLVPLSTQLRSGNRVEIITGRTGGPNTDWLRFTVSSRARSRIRQFTAKSRRSQAADRGRVMLVEALSDAGVPVRLQRIERLEEVAAGLGFSTTEALLAAVGERKLGADKVARKLVKGADELEETPALPRRKVRRRAKGWSVAVEGLDGIAVRRARCCDPAPGDEIGGYLSGGLRGRHVVVHRVNCPEGIRGHAGQLPLEVSWVGGSGAVTVTIEVEALDRPGLLADETKAISATGANITSAHLTSGRDMVARSRFEVQVSDSDAVDALCAALRALPNVFSAHRAGH